MHCAATLRPLSRPIICRICPLPGGGTESQHNLLRTRFLKVDSGVFLNEIATSLSARLLSTHSNLIRNVATRPLASKGTYLCFDRSRHFSNVWHIPYGCFRRLQHPQVQGQTYRLFRSQPAFRYEGKLAKTSDLQVRGSNNLLHFGAVVVGLTLFTYGSQYISNENFKLSSLFTKSVLASSDFQKNNFIADVVQMAAPAVVFLEIKGRHPLTGRPVTLSNGSGFIVRSNGIILTNAHVVANKSSVSVKLQDGRVFEGQVTAVDPISDLAAVKIPTSGLPTIPLGDSGDIRPGEWVIAMGSPLSLSNTVTCGIVSSVQRASKELGLRNKNMDYIQTDAVINFGNSGGPLVNLNGKAIGINTMKVTTGISFAIPSDYAIKFLAKAEALMKNGKTENGFLKRRYMGITMLTLTENVMRDLRNNVKMANFADVKGGVFVYKVIPGSPAHLGGILAGDIIIEISGSAIRSAADVYDAVEKADELQVTLIRGSEKKVISIRTQETI